MALLRQPCLYSVSSPDSNAQEQKEAHSEGDDGCVQPSSLEIIKHYYKNKPYADGGNDGVKIILLATFYYLNCTTGVFSHPPEKIIESSCLFACQSKHRVGAPQPRKYLGSQFLHSACFWHLQRRNNNYYEAHMAEERPFASHGLMDGLIPESFIARSNEKPKSVLFSPEVDRISLTTPGHHRNPVAGRSRAHQRTRQRKSKSTDNLSLWSPPSFHYSPSTNSPNSNHNCTTSWVYCSSSSSLTNQILARSAPYKLFQRFVAMDILVAAVSFIDASPAVPGTELQHLSVMAGCHPQSSASSATGQRKSPEEFPRNPQAAITLFTKSEEKWYNKISQFRKKNCITPFSRLPLYLLVYDSAALLIAGCDNYMLNTAPPAQP